MWVFDYAKALQIWHNIEAKRRAGRMHMISCTMMLLHQAYQIIGQRMNTFSI